MEPLDDLTIDTEDLTPVAKTALFGTRPWILFAAILGLIYIVFMVIVTIFSISSGASGAISNLFSVTISAYLYWLLFATAQKIKQFRLDGSPDTLEDALLNYKNYWMVTGILLLIAVAIIAFVFVIGGIAIASFM